MKKPPTSFLSLWLLLCLVTFSWSADKDHFFFHAGIDLDKDGQERTLGDRIPLIFVHGFRAEDAKKIKDDVHITFSFFRNHLVKRVKRGDAPFEVLAPYHYVYSPNKPYPLLGVDFAERMNKKFPGRALILVTHSAGALVARYAKKANIDSVISLSPAHGGSPGASIMWGNKTVLESGRLGKEGYETIVETLKTMGVKDSIAKSLAWDNADQVISKKDQKKAKKVRN